MKIALAQLNPTVGDLDGNLEKLAAALDRASRDGCDLLVLPELFLTGYPPRDLLELESFTRRCDEILEKLKRLSAAHPETAVLTGAVTRNPKTCGRRLQNSAVLVERGEIIFSQAKTLLPTYDVFDETRYFEPAARISVCPFGDEILGISICEDAWNDPLAPLPLQYDTNPLEKMSQAGASLLINLSASPYYLGKEKIRTQTLARQCQRWKLPLLMVNQIGGNDELIFDGCSLALDHQGSIHLQAAQFKEEIVVCDLDQLKQSKRNETGLTPPEPLQQVEEALVLGISDYFRKCGFQKTVIGLSGGIDSALTCTLAVKALGAEKVWGVTMPSPYSSGGSIEDSQALAANLGIRCDTVSIEELYNTYLKTLAPLFAGRKSDITEENIQARIRGNLLMALANKFNRLLLTTGNKSEMAVGYCTLYGDMSGGLAPISDLPKGMVYRLARYQNRDKILIPENTLTKEPSAELKPDQKDSDSLPPYETLDRVLELYIDHGLDAETIARQEKFPLATVSWIINAVNRNEYKRRQAPPGLKITSKAFGCGRRMPIAARF
ncbi:MAG: NAD+ synthase [Deltaproteobacteria bacterium]|nr:NAD+ synthase [Deltaproteobacteria bacterium]